MKTTLRATPQRRGHSMMEMFVVMSVMAGMAALSYPMLRSPLSKLRLQAAGQEVTSELAKARVKAMQTGVPQAFRFQIHTGNFQIAAAADVEHDSPADAKSKAEERVAHEAVQTSSSEHSPMTEGGDDLVEEKTLPDGICFEMPVDEEEPEQVQTEAGDNDEGWTNFAVFYPDGATTNAIVGLRGDPDLYLDIKLSGLTGVAKIGETHHLEQR